MVYCSIITHPRIATVQKTTQSQRIDMSTAHNILVFFITRKATTLVQKRTLVIPVKCVTCTLHPNQAETLAPP